MGEESFAFGAFFVFGGLFGFGLCACSSCRGFGREDRAMAAGRLIGCWGGGFLAHSQEAAGAAESGVWGIEEGVLF